MIKINHTGEPSRFNKETRRVPLEELSFNKFALLLLVMVLVRLV
jgi:hypothetical protein